METIIVYWGRMEKKMETTVVYWGIMEKKMETTVIYWGNIRVIVGLYLGASETGFIGFLQGLGFRGLGV